MISESKLSRYSCLIFYILTSALWLNNIYAQNILEDSGTSISSGDEANLFTEKISIISASGKIFILSNNNQLLSKGDFITMLLPGQGPLARAVVAKTQDEAVGIKVLKVYSLSRWKGIIKGIDVQILKGDDSVLFRPKKKEVSEGDQIKIESEEDLFNDKDIEGDLGDFYKDKRLIRPDNIVSIGWSRLSFDDATSETESAKVENQLLFSWSYQFFDNFWAEATWGRTSIADFPRIATQTIINRYSGKIKYTIEAPFYSYILPYLGFQTSSVSSPSAGTSGDTAQNARENATIDSLKKSSVIIGATGIKRVVPGWFLRGDLGTDFGSDYFSLGVSIEF